MKLYFPAFAMSGRTLTPPVIPTPELGSNATNKEKYDSLVSLIHHSAININEPAIEDLLRELYWSEDERLIFIPSQTVSNVISIPQGEECLVFTDNLFGCRAAFLLAKYNHGKRDLILSHFHGTYESHFKIALERMVENNLKDKNNIESCTFGFAPPVGIIDGTGYALPRKESFETCDLGDWLISGIDQTLKSRAKKLLLPYAPGDRHSNLALYFPKDKSAPVQLNVCGVHVGPIHDTKLIDHEEWEQIWREHFVPKEQESFWCKILSARSALVKEGLLSLDIRVKSPVKNLRNF